MRNKSFFGDGIRFDSRHDQECFEKNILLDLNIWKFHPGEQIGKGTFRIVREAILENLQNGEMKKVLQKTVHHPLGNKRLSLLEAFRIWKLQRFGISTPSFYRIDPKSLDLFVTDLRGGYGLCPGKSKVFDTNASEAYQEKLVDFFHEKPLANPEDVVQQIRNIFDLFNTNNIDAFTDEVFLMVVREHDAVMQVLLGDLKMMDFDQASSANAHSEKTLMEFLSRFGVVA